MYFPSSHYCKLYLEFMFLEEKSIASRLRLGRLGRSRPVSRVLFLRGGGSHQSRPAVADRLEQSTRKLRAGRPQALSYLILLRIGFTKLLPSPGVLVGSYPTFSPLPPENRVGCVFSVALSLGSPPLRVTEYPALWSPDFPLFRPESRNSDCLVYFGTADSVWGSGSGIGHRNRSQDWH